jgi:hypothetical protein
MTPEQTQFLKYVRTKMFFSLRLRTGSDELKPVLISAEEIERRFFGFNRKAEIQKLIDAGELKVTQSSGKVFYYEALKSGAFDLSLLVATPIPTDTVTQTMLGHLKNVSVPEAAGTTDYFNLFLKYKDSRPDLFFKVDSFCGRVHTPVSNLSRDLRPFILLNGEETTSIDVTTMQPLLLGKILYAALGENEYSTWINDGTDIYIKLQEKASLSSRDAAKKKFFEILFSKPNQELTMLFGASDWIEWISLYKGYNEPRNPHSNDKPWSNLAWLLQMTEVEMMRKIWMGLVHENIPFLTVHDEIIIPVSKAGEAELIMHEVLSKEFVFYKLSTKNKVVIPSSLSTLQPEVTEKKVLFDASLSTLATLKPVIVQEIQAAELTENGNKTVTKPSWNDQIAELEEYFATAAIPEGQVRLNVCSTITDIPAFIASHLAIVNANNGNRTYLPYLYRLQEVKLYLESINYRRVAA